MSTAEDISTHDQEDADQEERNRLLSTSVEFAVSPVCPASPDPPPPPPSAYDRGYAWVVVAAAFGITILDVGYVKSFGITNLLLLDKFPDASGAAGAAVMGLLIGITGLLAPLIGAISVKVGTRRCVVAGAFFTAFGLLLAIPCFSICYMAVTLGGIVGIGIGLCHTPSLLLIPEYFVEKRSLANGIVAVGSPLGGILFSPLVVFLNYQFGLQGSFMVMAGIMLNVAVLGMLMRPVELQEQILHHQHLRKIQSEPENIENGSGKTQAIKGSSLHKKALDLTLLKDPQFLVHLVMALCVSMSMTNFLLYIPAYGRAVGLTNYQSSFVVSYLCGADCILRTLCGFLVQKLHLKEAYVVIAGLLVGGVGCLVVPLCSSMWQLMLASTLYSFGQGTFWTLIVTLLANQFGVESLASSWGFFRMAQGITYFIYPSFLGLMKDLTGSLVVTFLIMGGGFILGATI